MRVGIIFAVLFVLLMSVLASAQTSCGGDQDCPQLRVCAVGVCVPRPCKTSDDCYGGVCIVGVQQCMPCGDFAKCVEPVVPVDLKPSKPRKPIREIVREELEKLPKPIDGRDGRNGRDAIDGRDGRNGRDAIDGRDGEDRPLNFQLGFTTGERQIGATSLWDVGLNLQMILKDFWIWKIEWEFGAALVQNRARQYLSSVGVTPLGFRLGSVDLGIKAEYGQTGRAPFAGWLRRSWTAGLEVVVYPLMWGDVSEKWQHFLGFGAYVGAGEEFRPGSINSEALVSFRGFVTLNYVF